MVSDMEDEEMEDFREVYTQEYLHGIGLTYALTT